MKYLLFLNLLFAISLASCEEKSRSENAEDKIKDKAEKVEDKAEDVEEKID